MNKLLLPLVLTIVIVAKVAATESARQVIEQLTKKIHASSTVYFNFNVNNRQIDNLLQTQLLLPKLITTACGQKTQLRFKFKANILSIVLLGESGLSESERQTLRQTLERWHHTDVLFVIDVTVKELKHWHWLFEWCWSSGFYNVLLIDSAASLYTFQPFPKLRMRQLQQLAQYLAERNNWYDLQGYAIRVAYGHHSPYALVYTNAQNQTIFTGFSPISLQIFAAHYNATILPIVMPNLQNYTLLDCYEYLQQRKVDVCADAAPWIDHQYRITTQRLTPGFLLVSFGEPLDKFRYFVLPFEPLVWLLIAVSVLYVTCVLTCIYWHQSGGHWNFSAFLLQVISIFIYISLDLRALQGKSIYIILFILMLVGFILTNFYLALLSSFLCANVYEHGINTWQDLQEQGVSILIDENIKPVFDMLEWPHNLATQLTVVHEEQLEMHRNILDPQYAYYCTMQTCDFYLYQQKFLTRPRMKVFPESLLSFLGGMPIADAWPLERLMNTFLSRNFASGLELRIYTDVQEEAMRAGYTQFFKTTYYDVVPLNINYVVMPGIILAFGYVTGLISFAFELLLQRLRK